MVTPLHDWWWGQPFPKKFLKGIHGPTGRLRQTMCCMHVWNYLNDQNFKMLRDAKIIRKDDGCSQNGVEDWVCGCVGLHHFLFMMIFWWPRNLNLVHLKASYAYVMATSLHNTNNWTWPITTWTQIPRGLNF
jgi:hypothetical protein